MANSSCEYVILLYMDDIVVFQKFFDHFKECRDYGVEALNGGATSFSIYKLLYKD